MGELRLKEPVVIIGIGEIGGVFARGFLRAGYPVCPITREMNLQQCAEEMPKPLLVLVAVGERNLPVVLEQMPAAWRQRLVLLQNELLPRDWQQHGLSNPTVISIWYEKKPGTDVQVHVPSPVFGQHSRYLIDALQALNIPVRELGTEEELIFELVRKNLYILTTNIAGLRVGGDVGTLWKEYQPLARAVASEVLAILAHLTGAELNHQRLIDAMVAAIKGYPQHQCLGRNALVRLERALKIAQSGGIDVPTMRRIHVETGG